MKTSEVITDLSSQSQAKLACAQASVGETSGKPAISSSCRIQSILLPIDFSAASARVLDYAIPFAEQFGAKLTLLHVIEPLIMPDFINPIPLMVDTSKLTAICKGELELLMKKNAVAPKLVKNVLVREGRSFHGITEAARELRTELIIMATHGYTGFDHVLMGSTAERVVRHAPCPVLVIRPHPDNLLDTGFRMKKILVPIDFSDCSRKAVSYAIALAHQKGAEVALLYVVAPVPYCGRGDSALFNYGICEPDYARLDSEMRSTGAEQLSKLVKEEMPSGIPITTLVRTGFPSQEITQIAKNIWADIVVISTHGHTGLKHVFLGSVAEHVVRHAPCPVLVVRERERDFA